MIRELSIRNYALIDKLSIEFFRGFSVFTGETGAGKSILIGAIGLLLGERASVDQIRRGTDEMEIIGTFELIHMSDILSQLLSNLNIDTEDNCLIIRRSILKNGRNRIFVNQIPVPLSTLRTLGNYLVDIHGQHEHQSLLRQETANIIINSLPEVKQVWSGYCSSYHDFLKTKANLVNYLKKVKELVQKKEFIEYQYNELVNLNLKPDEERLLEEEFKLLTTVTERLECVSSINLDIEGSGGQESIEKKMVNIRKNLHTLSKFDSCAKQWIDDLENCIVFFSELNAFCSNYIENNQVNLDTLKIDGINSRLAKIQRMKKKYLCTFDDLLKKQDDLKTQLDSIENTEFDKVRLEKELKCTEEKCREEATGLSAIRKKTSEIFDASISQQMDKLGFIEGKWRSQFHTDTNPAQNGFENITFEVCTNKGEPFLPLEKTASGGEISRLMLAIKTVLAENDNIPILIFDEIDTGIGGVLATEVAKTMYTLSNSHQIICISHLHQMASVADNHYRVYKVSENNRTVTKIERLNEKKKVEEISRMLGSDSTISKKHAKELLELRKAFH